MIFSLFKKNKDNNKVPEARMVKAPSPAAAAPAPQGPAGAAAPAGKPAAATPAAPAKPAGADPLSLDFTDLSLGDLESGGIELDNESDPLEAVVEQAAVLYANGQEGVAKATLEDAVGRYRAGPTAERLWMMLFDFYQLQGDKTAFENLELEFARTFERSPPAWCETKKAEAVVADGVPTALFKGAMEGSNHAAFGILADAMEKNPKQRLDLSKVQQLDDAGAERFLKLLLQSAKRKQTLELAGLEVLEKLLAEAARTGTPANPQCWLLQLELLQRFGQQEQFEERAVDYAVTFEVSPPSWDPARVQATPVAAAACPSCTDGDGQPDAYCLSGELKNARFNDLKAFAESRDPVVLDFTGVVRIDFVSAGALVNLLTPCKTAGKAVIIRNTNRLVFELLAVVGVNAVARIEPARK
ncbi:MAG TPA: STAS domain-containing protein [Azospira sp.]|nr:STAS domain-containing protein [Azospira sp.]